MAIFTYKCPDHGRFQKMMSRGTSEEECIVCKARSKRILITGNIRVVEKIDNGMMPRAIEQDVDSDEIMEERIEQHEKKKRDN